MIPSYLKYLTYLTEAQKKNLWIGTQIRNLVCMDSLAARFLSPEDHQKIRVILDANMSALGYETLTAHRERTRKCFPDESANKWSDKEWKEFYKYQKVEI